VLEEANRRLAEHRVSLHDAAAVSVYLRRAEDFAAMNEVYRTFAGEAPPTRTTVVANPVRPDALIELAVVQVGLEPFFPKGRCGPRAAATVRAHPITRVRRRN